MSNRTPRDDMKIKLENIWNNVQTNLPEINFDHDDSDLELLDQNSGMLFDKLEDFDVNGEDLSDTEKDFEKFLNRDFSSYNNNNSNNKSAVDVRSIKDIFLDDEDIVVGDEEGDSEFVEFRTNLNSKKTTNRKSEGVNNAQQITKNIFDSTSSKLNMDIFNSINFDEMISTVNTNKQHVFDTDEQNCYLRGVGTTSQNALKDEQVLQKLTEMSSNILKESDNDMFNVDTKKGGLLATTRCSTYTNKGLNPSYKKASNQSNNQSPLSILEEQLNKNTQSQIKNTSISLIEKQLGLNNEQARKNEMQQFLKNHKILDGNLVETRRLDLRAAQNSQPAPKPAVTVHNPVTAFLAMQMDIKNGVEPKGRVKPFRFLNERETDSDSSDSSDSEDDQVMGIARYRQQKMEAMKKAQMNN